MGSSIGRRIALAGAVVALVAVAGAPAARADFTFCPAGSEAGQCSNPRTQAVDYAEERLYVADQGNNRVNVFKTEDGSFLFSFAVTSPQYLVVDNDELSASFHSVYVVSSGQVVKFNAAGEEQKAFGAGSFNAIRGIGVAAGGVVYVIDTKNEGSCPEVGVGGSVFKKRVLKFNHEGEPIETVEFATAPCGQISAAAVDSGGNVYVVNEGASRALRKYDPSGTFVCKETEPVIETGALGFDQTQRLLAAQREQVAVQPAPAHRPITEYDTSCQVKRRYDYGRIPSLVNGIASLDADEGAFISEGSLGRFIERGPDPGPIVVPERTIATPIKSVWAEIGGEINPEGKTTEYRADYVEKSAWEEEGFASAIEGEEKTLGASAFGVAFAEGAVAGCKPFSSEALEEGECLIPETTYRFRLTAKDSEGKEDSEEGEFTTLEPLRIEALFASAVGIEAAALNATVNPLGAPATAHFEYVTQAACEEDEAAEGPEHCFDQAEEAGELDFGAGEEPQSRKATIGGLEPATAYRYRVVVENPLVPEPLLSKARTFTTFPEPEVPEPCPNDAFRTGPGALLPDCRAHEMVSPVDKDGGDVVTLFVRQVANQAALSGERVTYGSYRPFGDAASAPLTSQYLSERTGAGWQTEGIAPPQGRTVLGAVSFDFDFRAYSAELCEAWLMPLSEPEPELGEGSTPGHRNLYRRTDGRCTEDGLTHYEAISQGDPENLGRVFRLDPQGHSADGQVTVFAAQDTLSVGGAPAQPAGCVPASIDCKTRLYVKAAGGPLRYACILPSKAQSANNCSAGTKDGEVQFFSSGRLASLTGALSADGSRLYWTDSPGGGRPEKGRIYLRLNPSAGGAECTTPARPCTLDVSKAGEEASGSSMDSYFLGAAEDGSVAYYVTTSKGDIYEYDAETEESSLIADGFAAYMGIAADASSLYFASRSDLTPGQENSEGDEAEGGAANLYRYEAGEGGGFTFVARLAEADVEPLGFISTGFNLLSPTGAPGRRSSRVTPDGAHAAFTSVASLTGYDNTDVASEVPCDPEAEEGACDIELFRFDAGAREGEGAIACVSCNPSGARPEGVNLRSEGNPLWAAGWIGGWETNLYGSRNLSEDGSRVFFESSDALVARDTNGQVDVYQWEEPGTGSCNEAIPSFSAAAGGCIELISSGQSGFESSFIDASPTGDDVFFATLSSLYPGDPGQVDVYDARVGGGFAPPDPEAGICEGESCQSPAPAPEAPSYSTATNVGPGNLAAPKKKKAKRCPKGKRKVKRKGKVRCIKRKRSKKAQKRVHRNHSRRR